MVLLLCGLAVTGCRAFNVHAFGLPLAAQGSSDFSTELTGEEKAGVILLIGVAIASVAVGVAAAG